eukprot:365250-Chlamydomonas_euryale.AAC.4
MGGAGREGGTARVVEARIGWIGRDEGQRGLSKARRGDGEGRRQTGPGGCMRGNDARQSAPGWGVRKRTGGGGALVDGEGLAVLCSFLWGNAARQSARRAG